MRLTLGGRFDTVSDSIAHQLQDWRDQRLTDIAINFCILPKNRNLHLLVNTLGYLMRRQQHTISQRLQVDQPHVNNGLLHAV